MNYAKLLGMILISGFGTGIIADPNLQRFELIGVIMLVAAVGIAFAFSLKIDRLERK